MVVQGPQPTRPEMTAFMFEHVRKYTCDELNSFGGSSDASSTSMANKLSGNERAGRKSENPVLQGQKRLQNVRRRARL